MNRDSLSKTFFVAACLCIVCSLLVSLAAVLLRPAQQANKRDFMRKNILIAAGLFDVTMDVEDLFEDVETKIVDLETGEYTDQFQVEEYDQRKAAKDPEFSEALPFGEDPAVLKRREKYSLVYLIRKDDKLDQIVLPIRGYGLWSTLYGFLALDADTTTIRGITFYEHLETPGLGGEVDNPSWKAKWKNPNDPKKAFDEDWNLRIEVIKGVVTANDKMRQYKVDGLSGATITTRGLTNMLKFWLGENGFGPYLKNIRAEGSGNG